MCDRKNHPLKEILRTGYTDDKQNVVRWCPDCGAVVVDSEFDGRIDPGRVMKMRFPSQPAADQQKGSE